MTGPLASAGNSVRDGFLAAYYAENRRRPELHFHDTAGGLAKARTEAIRAGAQLLVGPLSREDVNNLVAETVSLPPTLLLNRPQQLVPDNGISFALSPEDEGSAAAERLLGRGLRRVVVFGQRDENSQRALGSFREMMQARGGVLLAEIDIPENQADLSTAVNNAFLLFFPFAFLTTAYLPQESMTGWLATVSCWRAWRRATRRGCPSARS